MHSLHRVVVVTAFLMVGGCDSSHPRPAPSYKVAGNVTYKGQPASEAKVIAVASGEDPLNSDTIKYEAQTGDDGSYFFGGHFPPLRPGKYDVRIVFQELPNPDKYNGRKPAFTIEVKSEDDMTVPPFQLQ